MTWYEILIIIAACLIVIGVIVASVVRKKQGKTGCGCDCGDQLVDQCLRGNI